MFDVHQDLTISPMVDKKPTPPVSRPRLSQKSGSRSLVPSNGGTSSTATPRRSGISSSRIGISRAGESKYTRTRGGSEANLPEYEYEQFGQKKEQESKWKMKVGLSGAVGAIGGFLVAGPPGALAGLVFAGAGGARAAGSSYTGNTGHDYSEAAKSEVPKWKREYRDPLELEPPNERRVKFLLKWALLKIDEGGNEDAIILLFDEVITHLSPWIARARMPDQVKEATRMIAHFGNFMDNPKVYQHFRLSNRAWLAAWELNQVDMSDAFYRFVLILPCLADMRDIIQPNGHNSPRICGATPPVAMASTYRSLDFIRDWVVETLDRSSVIEFVKNFSGKMEDTDTSMPGSDSPRRSNMQSQLELPPVGAEDEMDGNDDSDEFFDALEEPPMRSMSMLFHDYQKSCGRDDEEHRWDDSSYDWQVRSSSYIRDKVKTTSAPSSATLLAMDIAHSGGPDIAQMTNHKDSAYQCIRESGNSDFLLVINWRLPPMHVVCVFGMKDPETDLAFQLFRKMLPFERNQRLKVIPFCGEGPWLARTAIGSTPALIGKKLDVDYFDGPDFLEISINVFSSAAAKRMMNIVCGAAKKVVIDVALLVEATEEDELPERVLGAFRVIRTDITRMRQLYL